MFKLIKATPVIGLLLLTACNVTPKGTESAKVFQTKDSECSLESTRVLAEEMLAPYGVATPAFVASDVSEYTQSSGVVSLERCAPPEVVAHELGHYIFDVFVNFDYGAHLFEAQNRFCPQAPDCPGTWGPGDETHPGIEVSAHCIGEILHRKTPYTECPSKEMSLEASEILASLA